MNIKVRFHHEDSGNCQTTFKEINKTNYYNRVESDNYGRWYTVYPSNGYWENCSKVKKDVVFEVLDFKNNLLFTESNGNIGAFKSIGKKAKEISGKWVDKLSLRSHKKWYEWLLNEMTYSGYKGYIDNWLYVEPKSESYKKIGKYEHLGIGFSVVRENMTHPVCGKKWTSVYIVNNNSDICEEICGYIFTE